MKVVLAQQIHSDEYIVDVPKYQGPFLGVPLPTLDECLWVVSPVPARVQVVRGVVSVVEREAVALLLLVCKSNEGRGSTYRYIDEGDTRAVVRVRVDWIDERVLAPVSNHQPAPHNGQREDEHE